MLYKNSIIPTSCLEVAPGIIQNTTASLPGNLKSLLATYGASTHSSSPTLPDFSNKEKPQRYHDHDWSFYDAPTDLLRLRYHNGRYWYFCTKCGRNGRWICTHKDATYKAYTDDAQHHYHSDDRSAVTQSPSPGLSRSNPFPSSKGARHHLPATGLDSAKYDLPHRPTQNQYDYHGRRSYSPSGYHS